MFGLHESALKNTVRVVVKGKKVAPPKSVASQELLGVGRIVSHVTFVLQHPDVAASGIAALALALESEIEAHPGTGHSANGEERFISAPFAAA